MVERADWYRGTRREKYPMISLSKSLTVSTRRSSVTVKAQDALISVGACSRTHSVEGKLVVAYSAGKT